MTVELWEPGTVAPVVDRSAERVGRIGSADVGAVLGLNPYRSALDVYQTIRGEHSTDLSGVLRVSIGRELEALGLSEYATETGRTPERVGTISHPDRPYLSATPDGFDAEGETVTEVKCTWAGWPEPPAYYWAQVRWQALALVLTGRTVETLCIVVLRLGGWSPRVEYHRRPFDRAEAEADLASIVTWWADHIETETPPRAAAESLADGSLARKHGEGDEGKVIDADAEGADLLESYQVWRLRKEFATRQETEAKARICDRIGSKSKGLKAEGIGKALWSRRKGAVKTDWKAVAETAGATEEQIEQHTRVTAGGRSFRWTAAKPKQEEP